MQILIIHNHYQQRGGEDIVSQAERALLQRNGQKVYFYERNNREVNAYSWVRKIDRLSRMDWSQEAYKDIIQILKSFHPDIVHVYNTHFMITPSVYYACKEYGVPVVQSLYNFRFICANALLLRNGQHCEECLHHSRWRSVLYRCYRNSFIQTACVVKMQNSHWRRKTWMDLVDAYITANAYSRDKFIQAGIPKEKFYIKPHFIDPDPVPRKEIRDYALYVGRLSNEKGVKILLQAWENLPQTPLKVMGAGPLLDELRQTVKSKKMRHVEILGYRPDEEFIQSLKEAKFLIVPSISHDNSPRTILEAFSLGVPVLASSIDGVGEMIKDKLTGRLFSPGDATDLANKARWLAEDDTRLRRMGESGRQEYEQNYTADKNYKILMNIYNQTIERYQCQG